MADISLDESVDDDGHRHRHSGSVQGARKRSSKKQRAGFSSILVESPPASPARRRQDGASDVVHLHDDEEASDDSLDDEFSSLPRSSASPSFFSSFKADLASAVKYTWNDTKRHRRNCFVGFFTVALVVAFIGLLQASIARSPVIFMKLAEDEVGDFDVLATPSFSAAASSSSSSSSSSSLTSSDTSGSDSVLSGLLPSSFESPLLNFTAYNEALQDVPLVVGSAPRWLTFVRLFNAERPQFNGSAILLAIDDARERELKIGRAWSHGPLAAQQTHVSSVLLRRLNITAQAGENITVVIDLIGTLQQLTGTSLGSLLAGTGSGGGGGDSPLGLLGNATLNSLLDRALDSAGAGSSSLTIKATVETGWSLLRSQLPGLGLPPFDELPLDAPLTSLLGSALENGLTLRSNFTVIDGIESPGGKFPKALGNVAVIEARHLHQLLDAQVERARDSLRQVLDSGLLLGAAEALLNITDVDLRSDVRRLDTLLGSLENFDIDHFALSAVSMYRDRLEAYVKDGPGISLEMIKLTDAIARGLGTQFAQRVSLSTPLSGALSTLYFIRLFLDQIFTFVSAVLIGLGSLLIYSLLLANVEEKTYEYGMLRALGMRHYVLIELLIVQALLFAVPGILIGLGAAFTLYIPAAAVLSYFVDVPLDLSMSPGSVITGVVIGLIMPAVANIAPIRRALGAALRDALDMYHDARSATTVTVVRLARVGLSPWQLVVATLLVVMGFVVYYLVPFAFIFNNLPLFLMLLTLILLGMLVGFSVVSQVLEPLCERLFLRLIMWGADWRQLSDLVRKSLHAHAGRNRKTAAMFTVALAFIVFVGVSFALQGVSIRSNVQLGIGADVVILAPTLRSALDERSMRQYLDGEIARREAGASDAHVLSYTFQTFALTDLGFVRSTHLSNLAGFPDRRVRVVAVDANYLESTYSQYYRASEVASSLQFNETASGQPDIIESLYANAGLLRLQSEIDAAGGSVDDPPYVPPVVAATGVRERSGTLNPDGSVVRQSSADVYRNYTDIAISESLRLEASLDTTTPMYLRLEFQRDVDASNLNLYLLCKADGMIRKMAGELTYSSYRQLSQNSQMLVSLPAYKRMLRWMRVEGAGYGLSVSGVIGGGGANGLASSSSSSSSSTAVDPFEPPKAKLYVRLVDDASSLDREDVINSLRTFIADDVTQVLDTNALVDSTSVALDVLNVFFVVVTVIAVTLCFFVLWLSFTANLRENSWEFGVLRALGLTASQVVRVYIYEALSLVLSSLLLGTIIGLAQASTLTLQFLLFTELPFTMSFPYALYLAVVAMSFIVAILGAYVPARKFKKKQIAFVLKGL